MTAHTGTERRHGPTLCPEFGPPSEIVLGVCLAILVFLTLINLRGTRDTGLTFLVPTYLFVGTLATIILIGGAKAFAALDRYLPDAFALRGRRLVFSYGVVVLSLLAAWINLMGAIATGITTIVVALSKFTEGAWLAIVALLALVFMFARIHRHYGVVAKQVADDEPLDLSNTEPPIIVVPIQTWNKLASRGLRFAIELSSDVHALHILTQDSTISELTVVWEELVAAPARAAGRAAPKLVLRKSTYRQFFAPLIEYVEKLRDETPNRDIVVIVPDLVVRRWYHAILHNNRGAWLRTLLRLRGGPRVVVNTPFHLAD